ncbi:hypothetical protein ACU4GI_40815 [Cupriavidus basilensis]|uniref:hypothetical protein n=1 Tax=Cupriavidus TaxID=106589 RepID=UPI00126807EB|nr:MULTISPECIES: hypothetical protein [Cupriavidus]MDF3887219.1 hypothetical protein [Cupriavidus basilensis]
MKRKDERIGGGAGLPWDFGNALQGALIKSNRGQTGTLPAPRFLVRIHQPKEQNVSSKKQ